MGNGKMVMEWRRKQSFFFLVAMGEKMCDCGSEPGVNKGLIIVFLCVCV